MSNLSRNFLFLAGSNFAVQIVRFFTIALVARRMSGELFGAYNYLILLTAYGATFVEFGLKNVAIREFAQGRGSRILIKHIIQIRLCLAGVGALVVLALVRRAFPSGDFLIPSVIFGLSLVANALLFDFLVIVEEKFSIQGTANFAQAAFCFVGVFAFVRSSHHFLALAAIFFFGQVLWVAVFYFGSHAWRNRLAKSSDTSRDDQNRFFAIETARQGIPFLAAFLFFTIQSSMDLLLLGQFRHHAVLGDYSAALKIISIPLGLIGAFVTTMQPRIARESGDFRSPTLLRLLDHTCRGVWLILVPSVIGCWLFGDQIVLWVFGRDFPRAADFLKPLSLAFLFSCLSLAPVQAFTTSSRTRTLTKLVLGNAFFTFTSVFIVLYLGRISLVPWAMVASQFVLMASVWAPFNDRAYATLEDVRNLLVPSALMTIPLVSGRAHFPPLVVFALSAIGYGTGLFLIRIWRRPWFKTLTQR